MDDDLLRTDFAGLAEPAQIDAAVGIEVLQARLDAARLRLYAAIDAGAAHDEKHWVEDELCAALRVSPVVVAERMHTARTLTTRLPATLELLESGAISVRHARALVDGVEGLDDAVTAKVEARVLERAPQQTAAAFRKSVRRTVASVDPRREEEQHAVAVEQRRVCARPEAFGMTEIWALLPADGAAMVMTALTACAATKIDGDERTMDQKRADALVALAALRLEDAELPKWQGRRPRVQVTVAASTLLGLDDEPGDLDGHGPIPASMARAIAGDPVRHLAPAAHRPRRSPHRFEQDVPAPGRAGRIRPSQRPPLSVPRLPQTSETHRTRPPVGLVLRRTHQPREPRMPLQPTPPAEAPSGLAGHRRPVRDDYLDQPDRPHLPVATRALRLGAADRGDAADAGCRWSEVQFG